MNRARHIAKLSLAGLSLLVLVLLSGCASKSPAPVIDHAVRAGLHEESVSAPLSSDMVVVKKGDTLRSIALDHGQSYRDLAAWNGLTDPDKITVGQQLRVAPPGAGNVNNVNNAEPVAVARPVNMSGALEPNDAKATQAQGALPASAAVSAATVGAADMLKRSPKGAKLVYSPEALAKLQKPDVLTAATVAMASEPKPEAARLTEKTPAAPVVSDSIDWIWPAGGKLLGGFVEGSNKGLDIAGKAGDPVLAAAAGKVILVSSALRGYGNFVIVKHNAAYLSVYAHNSRILVKEEQTVSKGQKIAEIGSSDADQPKLHFEIRRQGKPVDPAKFLPAR